MYEIVEPRLEFLKNEVERILSLVRLEKNGRPINVDGFRLRNPEHWRTGFAQNIFDVLGPLSGICNVECAFCMERNLPFERDKSFLSTAEAATRLKYYSSESQRCLFPTTRPHMETFFNRDAVAILQRARQASPEELFIITTNGTTLTPEIVRQLAEIKPLLIKFSVNSMDDAVRKSLMGLRDHMKTARDGMRLLKEAGIPFTGSLVAWPGIGNDELEATIKAIDGYSPYGIRVRLPLVHKYSPAQPAADLNRFWRETAEFIDSIKTNVDAPLWIEPIQYGRTPVVALLDGVIRNSPAMKAGLRSGDLIVRLDEKKVFSRFEVRELFGTDEFKNKDELTVEIKRGEQLLTFKLDSITAGSTYPYDKHLNHPGERFGMLLLPDFDLGFLDNILRLADKHGAEKILLFASPLTAGTVENLITRASPYREFFATRDLWLYTLESTWMEGNTAMLDSRFVADYEKNIFKTCMQLKTKPDLILIPDCFGSSWGIDFHGRSAFEIERKIDVPVELIPWHYIYGRED